MNDIYDNDIHINVEEIPKFRVRELVQCILDMMEEAFSDPAMEERYQKWLAEKKAIDAKKGADSNATLLDAP